MTAIETSWLVGSVTLSSSATIVVGGNDAVIAAGTYYLRDATGSLSLLGLIETAIAAHYAGSTCRLLKNRKIKIDLNGNSVALTIPSTLQALLGFTGSPYGAASSRTAEAVSTLLWSPAWPETTEGHPTGTSGYRSPDWVQTASPSGLTIRTTLHGTAPVLTELAWSHVERARVRTTDDGEPGEFQRWMTDVAEPGYRWKLYSGISEDAASSAEVTWTTAKGPYVLRDPEWRWFNRSIANVDRMSNIKIKGTLTGEIS